MTPLSFEHLKAIPELKAYPVSVPELGPDVEAWIGELTANERDDRIEMGWSKHKDAIGQKHDEGQTAWIVAACLCTGPERIFLCNDFKSLELAADTLGKHGKAVIRMFRKVTEVNGIGTEQAATIEKN